MFTVKGHDGAESKHVNRNDAVYWIKEYLSQWMVDEGTDRLAWDWMSADHSEQSDTRTPNSAQVVTEHGEPTDAWAQIIRD